MKVALRAIIIQMLLKAPVITTIRPCWKVETPWPAQTSGTHYLQSFSSPFSLGPISMPDLATAAHRPLRSCWSLQPPPPMGEPPRHRSLSTEKRTASTKRLPPEEAENLEWRTRGTATVENCSTTGQAATVARV